MQFVLSRRDRTRRAILDALAVVIADTGGIGFSVQQVAERAGVTHRTVYNHFPTRDALNDALAEHVEDVMTRGGHPALPIPTSAAALVPVVAATYAVFQKYEAPLRANVMLMLASRRPARVTRHRTAAFEKVIARDTVPPAPVTSRGVTAAVRMFLSSTGWHLLTEQMELPPGEAAATATWAVQTLLEAASRRRSVSTRNATAPARTRKARAATTTKRAKRAKTPRGSR